MGTFTDNVRTAFLALGKENAAVTAKAVAAALGLDSYEKRRPLYTAITDMRRRGELVTGKKNGVYHVVDTPVLKKPYMRTVMWRLLRSRTHVTVEDLQELAGASNYYAREWLKMLVRRGIVKRMDSGKYRLIEDTVDEPIDTDHIDRMRRWRKQKTQALAALDNASEAIESARSVLCEEKKRPGDVTPS